jgi:hypothetical protein
MRYVCFFTATYDVAEITVTSDDSPRTVIELDTSMDSSHTSAILKPTNLFVE